MSINRHQAEESMPTSYLVQSKASLRSSHEFVRFYNILGGLKNFQKCIAGSKAGWHHGLAFLLNCVMYTPII